MAKCGVGKNGARQQKQLLTLLMKPTTKDLSRSNVQSDFHLRVERARQNFSTPHRKDDKVELSTSESFVYYAAMKIGEK